MKNWALKIARMFGVFGCLAIGAALGWTLGPLWQWFIYVSDGHTFLAPFLVLFGLGVVFAAYYQSLDFLAYGFWSGILVGGVIAIFNVLFFEGPQGISIAEFQNMMAVCFGLLGLLVGIEVCQPKPKVAPENGLVAE